MMILKPTSTVLMYWIHSTCHYYFSILFDMTTTWESIQKSARKLGTFSSTKYEYWRMGQQYYYWDMTVLLYSILQYNQGGTKKKKAVSSAMIRRQSITDKKRSRWIVLTKILVPWHRIKPSPLSLLLQFLTYICKFDFSPARNCHESWCTFAIGVIITTI